MSATEQNVPDSQAICLIGDSLEGISQYRCYPSKESPNSAATNPNQERMFAQQTTLKTSNTIRNDGDSTVNEGSSSSSVRLEPRLCGGTCGQPIPAKRLAVRPNARLCVTCQVEAGDIPQTLRFDEFNRDGDQVMTYFNQSCADAALINRYMRRMSAVVTEDIFFDIARGDDSHLTREGDSVIDTARSLSSEFEDDEAPNLIEMKPVAMKIAA